MRSDPRKASSWSLAGCGLSWSVGGTLPRASNRAARWASTVKRWTMTHQMCPGVMTRPRTGAPASGAAPLGRPAAWSAARAVASTPSASPPVLRLPMFSGPHLALYCFTRATVQLFTRIWGGALRHGPL